MDNLVDVLWISDKKAEILGVNQNIRQQREKAREWAYWNKTERKKKEWMSNIIKL